MQIGQGGIVPLDPDLLHVAVARQHPGLLGKRKFPLNGGPSLDSRGKQLRGRSPHPGGGGNKAYEKPLDWADHRRLDARPGVLFL